MQIHELNNYDGELNSSSYMAIDNGTDTGKLSVAELLADTNDNIDQLNTDLNARIDNIIAGGTAPSAEEVTDARLEASNLGGKTYASLGAAIRGQTSQLETEISGLRNNDYSRVPLTWSRGFVSVSTGDIVDSNGYVCSQKIPVWDGAEIAFKSTVSSSILAVAFYSDETETADLTDSPYGNGTSVDVIGLVPYGTKYIRISCDKALTDSCYLGIKQKSNQDFKNELNDFANDISTNLYQKVFDYMEGGALVPGYFSGETLVPAALTSGMRTTDYFRIDPGKKYNVITEGYVEDTVSLRYINLYDENKNYLRSIAAGEQIQNNWFLSLYNEYYARVNVLGKNIGNIIIAENGFDNNKIELTEEPLKSVLSNYQQRTKNIIRKPIIAFMLDGIYLMNDTMLNVLKSHGYYGGVAILQRNYTYGGEYLLSVRTWKNQGHEILAHGSVLLNDDYDEAEGAAVIKACYEVPKSYGIDVDGFIASNGVLADKFLPYVKNYFTWGADRYNRSASDTPYHLFRTSDPFLLWRYSMELSSLQQQKDAVDAAINNTGLLLFYAHAHEESEAGYFTAENFEALLTYIDEKVSDCKVRVLKPTEAVTDYYTVRREDIITE